MCDISIHRVEEIIMDPVVQLEGGSYALNMYVRTGYLKKTSPIEMITLFSKDRGVLEKLTLKEEQEGD